MHIFLMKNDRQTMDMLFDLRFMLQITTAFNLIHFFKAKASLDVKPSSHQMNPSETCHSSLKDFSKFGSLHWREALAGDNHGVADQKQSAMGRQSGGGCLAHVCNLFSLTKVQPVLQCCKLASYCEAKATNLKTANHHSM